MLNEPRWLPVEALIEINAVEVGTTGEPHQLLSLSLLESAWAKPLNRFAYEGVDDVLRLSVSLMLGVAQNHPFQQGNKRTAFHAGLLFLKANGQSLSPSLNTLQFADDFVRLVEHVIDEDAFVDMLRPHVVGYARS